MSNAAQLLAPCFVLFHRVGVWGLSMFLVRDFRTSLKVVGALFVSNDIAHPVGADNDRQAAISLEAPSRLRPRRRFCPRPHVGLPAIGVDRSIDSGW